MPASSYRLEDLLPHRSPMILIDEIVDFDAVNNTLTTSVTVKEPWTANHVAVEYMAQTAAALAGLSDRLSDSDCAPRPGFLLGTRVMDLEIDRFEPGATYLVFATYEFFDSNTASFNCRISRDGETVASAIINAYRPENMRSFIAEYS